MAVVMQTGQPQFYTGLSGDTKPTQTTTIYRAYIDSWGQLVPADQASKVALAAL